MQAEASTIERALHEVPARVRRQRRELRTAGERHLRLVHAPTPAQQTIALPRTSRLTAAPSRAIDVTLSAMALLVAGPLMALIAAVIAVSDGGSPVFRQRRVGLDGREFDIMKFRTMVRDAEARLAEVLAADPELRDEFAQTCKLRNDPRVSRFGRWLRASGLDELPQLINVVRGDMSLVGPRPVPAHELRRYGRDAGVVTLVRPGITGPWQISDRSTISYAERVAIDCEYVRTKTVRGDLTLIARTGAKFAAGRLGGW